MNKLKQFGAKSSSLPNLWEGDAITIITPSLKVIFSYTQKYMSLSIVTRDLFKLIDYGNGIFARDHVNDCYKIYIIPYSGSKIHAKGIYY